ncbi:MAG: GTP 3',8-cyclase MoaA [Deltaproteobacteria bacterium]|nr:GTP 3',8-cyclase MoaA [Candidatus Anaeroferrophillacea bacterium]
MVLGSYHRFYPAAGTPAAGAGETVLLRDGCNRPVSYLRVSVTDRCNLRCRYCVAGELFDFIPCAGILRYEEIVRVVRALAPVGIDKVRLTGGEPLVRRGLPRLVAMLRQIDGIRDVGLTTNGVLFAECGRELRDAGLTRVNISLDTLRRDRFAELTRRDFFSRAMAGIDAAVELGFDPVKINVVAMRGVNDDELVDFVRFGRDRGVEVRFIEYMPVGQGTGWQEASFISAAEIRDRLAAACGPLEPAPPEFSGGPARIWRVTDGGVRIGFISALSDHFCDRCNRVRITADGRLRPCLLEDTEYDLRGLLRAPGVTDAAIRELFFQGLASKPAGHGMSCNAPRKCQRPMSSIGG